MYCMHCGEKLPDNVKFCQYCGGAVQTRTFAAPPVAAHVSPQNSSATVPTAASPEAVLHAPQNSRKSHSAFRVLLTILWVLAASVAALFFGVLLGYALGSGVTNTNAAAAASDVQKAYVSIDACSIDTVECTVRCSPLCGQVEVYAVLYAEDGVLTLRSTASLLTFDAGTSAALQHPVLALHDADYLINEKTFTADDGTTLPEGTVDSLASYIERGMMVRMVEVQLICGDTVIDSARETLYC